ncbi:hypothetical protein WJX81_003000 [Elliptochloris bilobata]|uniref:RING-type domain-containing protein n=1 Tax=Elliptochloris bilobata TaxID=381761 RepID=A0AAW1SHC7_9CHLO
MGSLQCPICLDVAGSADDNTWDVLPCGHIFHTTCVAKALGKNRTCPNCRADVYREDAERIYPTFGRSATPSRTPARPRSPRAPPSPGSSPAHAAALGELRARQAEAALQAKEVQLLAKLVELRARDARVHDLEVQLDTFQGAIAAAEAKLAAAEHAASTAEDRVEAVERIADRRVRAAQQREAEADARVAAMKAEAEEKLKQMRQKMHHDTQQAKSSHDLTNGKLNKLRNREAELMAENAKLRLRVEVELGRPALTELLLQMTTRSRGGGRTAAVDDCAKLLEEQNATYVALMARHKAVLEQQRATQRRLRDSEARIWPLEERLASLQAALAARKDAHTGAGARERDSVLDECGLLSPAQLPPMRMALPSMPVGEASFLPKGPARGAVVADNGVLVRHGADGRGGRAKVLRPADSAAPQASWRAPPEHAAGSSLPSRIAQPPAGAKHGRGNPRHVSGAGLTIKHFFLSAQ